MAAPEARTGEVPPARGTLQGLRDPRSCHAARLGGSGREQRDQSFVLNPPSRNTCAAVAGGGERQTAAGAGTIPRVSRGCKVGTQWPPAAPAHGHGGSAPQPPTGSQRLFSPPARRALQTAHHGLNFALERGLEAFRLQEHRARVFGPGAGPSIPPMPAHSRFPPCAGQRTAGSAGSRLTGTAGAETHARPQPSRSLGLNAAKRRAAGQLGPRFSQRGAQLTRGGERSAGAPPCTYSGILSTAGSV